MALSLRLNGSIEVMQEEELVAKIRSLPPDRMAELVDFVEFLSQRDDRLLTQAATKASEPVFAQVWENEEDAVYDNL
jgi:hypothetical protein